MITFPDCVGYKQETYVIPTACPNECNASVLPLYVISWFQHAHIHKHVHPADVPALGVVSSLQA